jgi:hypothetical protein
MLNPLETSQARPAGVIPFPDGSLLHRAVYRSYELNGEQKFPLSLDSMPHISVILWAVGSFCQFKFDLSNHTLLVLMYKHVPYTPNAVFTIDFRLLRSVAPEM